MTRDTQWYVECDGIANENISALLRAGADGGEAESFMKRDKDGSPHRVLRITRDLIRTLKKMKRENKKVYGSIRFFVEDTTDGTIRPADFLENQSGASAKSVVKAAVDHVLATRGKNGNSKTRQLIRRGG